jgi:hypothetical protein
VASPSWTAHETAFLAWARLRVALGQALGLPDPRVLRPKEFPHAPERPAALQQCSPACARRAAEQLARQGLAVPAPDGKAWLLPATSPTGIEACWNLVPGFHGRWPTLWDLHALEAGFGSRAFTGAAAVAWLARHDAQAASSPQHRRLRSAPPPAGADARLRNLVAEGWLGEAASGLHLARSAQDALTLLRIIAGARVQLPPGGLDSIGRIRVPHPANGKAGGKAGGAAPAGAARPAGPARLPAGAPPAFKPQGRAGAR